MPNSQANFNEADHNDQQLSKQKLTPESVSDGYVSEALNLFDSFGKSLYSYYNYIGNSITLKSAPFPSLMERKGILCVTFNQDSTCLAVGHDDGYTFYDVRSIDKLNNIHEGKVPERTFIVERLYMSSLIITVSMKTTRKLQVYHSAKENEICCHTYASSIISVRMNRKRVVVCLEDSLHIHNVKDMRLMHIIKDTPPNPQGTMDLSNDETACFLAFPGSNTTGHVHIYDAENLKAMCQFSAHSGPLAALKFNSEGTKLATASNKGTVIRVFGIPNGDRLFEFTRGVKRCVQISSLAFSVDSRYLCLSSNTETVHVFTLQGGSDSQQEHSVKRDDSNEAGIGAWVNYFSQQATAYLPTQMNELMLREKSTTTAKLPIIGSQTVVAMPRINGTDYLLVASVDGYFFCYTLATDGGECTLMRQYRIGPESADDGADNDLLGTPIPIPEKSKSSSSLTRKTSVDSLSSHSQPSTSSARKSTPPPIPPAPKKRAESTSEGRKSVSTLKKEASNPFESEDLLSLSDDSKPRSGGGGGGGLTEMMPPADLNDLEEFPPLTHVTD